MHFSGLYSMVPFAAAPVFEAWQVLFVLFSMPVIFRLCRMVKDEVSPVLLWVMAGFTIGITLLHWQELQSQGEILANSVVRAFR